MRELQTNIVLGRCLVQQWHAWQGGLHSHKMVVCDLGLSSQVISEQGQPQDQWCPMQGAHIAPILPSPSIHPTYQTASQTLVVPWHPEIVSCQKCPQGLFWAKRGREGPQEPMLCSSHHPPRLSDAGCGSR